MLSPAMIETNNRAASHSPIAKPIAKKARFYLAEEFECRNFAHK